ncbi:MAG TPA: EAL domain-containing protein [Acidimicrobiales bacterium]|nr:EAL domain-containing protein [Acidimicrobiales bacterium]
MEREPADVDADETPRDLMLELAEAIEHEQFFMVYQPTIDLQTNAFAGVEALIRWRHPRLGDLSPDSFINELEASGQILPVGRWALNTACAQGADWHDRGYRFNVSVNVSKRQFDLTQFFQDVAEALSSSRFDPSLLVLELAQKTLLDDRVVAAARLEKLKTLGVRFAVDDFEPGASAIEELEEFPIDIVKLDREFIARLATSTEAASLVHGLMQRSEKRHLQVIASGIEDSEQRQRLQNEMVQVGQGYLFSKPHEAEEIDRYLEDFAIFSGKPL